MLNSKVSFLALLGFVVLAAWLPGSANALKCFVCNSQFGANNDTCDEPVLGKQQAITCPTGAVQCIKIKSHDSEYALQQALNDIKTGNVSVVSRHCSSVKYEEGCQFRQGPRSRVVHCYCSGDKCNGASSLHAAVSMSVLFTAASALLVKFY